MTWPPPRPPWWVPIVAVGIAVAVLVWALNSRRAAVREREAAEELHRLEVAGLNAAHQVDRDALMQDLLAEATASAQLAEELARIQAAAPGAKPIATAHGSTPWKPVGPAASNPPAVSPPASPGSPAPPVPASPGVPGGTCPPCRLWVGDEMQVRATGAAMETDLGNVVVAAAASVWRRPAGGGPEEELHAEKLKLDVKILEAAREKAWGGGPALFAGGWGWALGGVLATPPLRVLGLQVEPLVGAGIGPAGSWAVMVAAPIR